ncbi:MAG: HAD family hydrolase [Anaerotardibacter sp.]
MNNNKYKAVFFDLDGTLLPMDMDLFLKQYFGLIGQFAAKQGLDAKKFMDALLAGTGAMTQGYPAAGDDNILTEGAAQSNSNEGAAQEAVVNSARFWSVFSSFMGMSEEEAEPLFMEFYTHDFCQLGQAVEANPLAGKIVETLKEKGYTLYLTTMPLFPEVAVVERLSWAQVDAAAFDRITTFDNSTSTKPFIEYYQENIDHSGFKPEEILMVGNNTREDLACLETGMDAYLITDWILNPNDFNVNQVKHGTMEEFYEFVCNLPECK